MRLFDLMIGLIALLCGVSLLAMGHWYPMEADPIAENNMRWLLMVAGAGSMCIGLVTISCAPDKRR